ncbi:alcohol acetyltransferase-domain-containing protein [Mycena capillaripes]|nr:alcohol acetyltransferase-domain-containing protein [Mycena capillaripes]
MSSSLCGHRIRRLGMMERYHATRHFLGMDACVVTSARYTTPEGTVLTKELLFPALRVVIEAHALLGVRFDGRDDALDVAYLRLPSVDLTRVVEFSENCDLQDALTKQVRRFEDTQGDLPLWRLEVLPDNTVILAIHHGIGDGMSSAAFHTSLLQALQKPALQTFSSSVVVPDIRLLPPIEDVTDVRPSLFAILGVLYQMFFPWSETNTSWTGRPVPTDIALQTHVRLLSFEPWEAKAFSDICRSHNATLTAAIHELTVCVLSRLLTADPSSDSAKSKTVSINVPVSLRDAAGVGFGEVCNYTSSAYLYPPLHSEFSWAGAARVAGELRVQKMKSRERLGMVRWVAGDFTRFMKGQLGMKRGYGVIISNLGRFQPVGEGKKLTVPEEKSWTIGDIFFNQCDSLAGAALALNVVSDPAGQLNIGITWGDKSLDVAFVEAFIAMFREAFHALLA